jgi:hypothetical protein
VNHRSTLTTHFPPQVTPEVQKQFDKKFSMWIYHKGLAFSLWDEEFQQIISFLRPGIKVPSRDRLAGVLLRQSYDKTQNTLKRFLGTGIIKMTLGFDSWTDVTSESIINFMAMSATQSYLVASMNTGTDSHNAENLAKWAKDLILENKDAYAGAITDNTSTNKSMWETLKREFPTKFFYGCAAHVWHLLVKDLFTLPAKYSSNPEGFILNCFVELHESCTEIIKTFKRGRFKQELKEYKEFHNLRSLKLSGETRWGSTYRMFYEFDIWLRTFLFTLFDNEAWRNEGKTKIKAWKLKIRALINSNEFRDNLARALSILGLVDRNLNRCQSDEIFVSDIYEQWVVLQTEVGDLFIPESQKAHIQKEITKRWNFLKSDCHKIGYFLDPRYCAYGMSPEENAETDLLIESLLADNATNKQEVKLKYRKEIKSFLAYASQYANYLNDRTRDISPLSWWQTQHRNYPTINSLAVNIFSLVVSTSTVERSFKMRGNIHTKIRNRLSHETTSMLMTIKANKDLLFETNPLVNMKRNINDEEITKKTDDDEGNGVDEQMYHPFIDLSFEDEENNSEESDGSDLSSDSNEEPERKEADEGYEVV